MKDWTGIFAKFKGRWVALGDDETTVLASGRSAREALQKARKEGHPHPILTRMPESLGTYVGRV